MFIKKYIDEYKKKTGKNKTVKSNMFNCLINDDYLLEILQFCNNRWNSPEKQSKKLIFVKICGIISNKTIQ